MEEKKEKTRKFLRSFYDVEFTAEFRLLPVAAHGTWHRLCLEGLQRMNGGRFNDVRSWGDREWAVVAGVSKADIDLAVACGLARWEPPSGRPTDPTTQPADLGSIPDRSGIDPGSVGGASRPIPTDPGSAECVDLVLAFYDHEGEGMLSKATEDAKIRASARWSPDQQQLPLPPPRPRQPTTRPVDPGSIRDRSAPIPTDPCNADLRSEISRSPPPTPSSGGGGKLSLSQAEPDAALHWQTFWEWLKAARPASVRRKGEGWLKSALPCLDTLARALGKAQRLTGERLSVEGACELLREDLTARFSSPDVHLRDWDNFRTYLASKAWFEPLQLPKAPKARVLSLVTDEEAARVAEERRTSWAEQFPDEPYPGDEEARRRLMAKAVEEANPRHWGGAT